MADCCWLPAVGTDAERLRHAQNWYHNGFKVGPNYGRPAAPVADAWLDAYDQRVRSELPNNPRWWEVFNDPQAERADPVDL